MEAATAILEPLELQFADLLLLSSAAGAGGRSGAAPPSSDELERLESVSSAVMQALGPTGPGLLSVTGVPRAPGLRRKLLPLARKLALLGNKDRARILKEHGLGSDVPLKNLDRSVSSFALQLRYTHGSDIESFSGDQTDTEEGRFSVEENSVIQRLQGFHDNEFQYLRVTFKELGLCIMELGLRLAQICDKAIGGGVLEQSILDSLIAKGRLIHYHSVWDKLILKEVNKTTRGSTQKAEPDSMFPSLSHVSEASANKAIPCPGMGNPYEQKAREHFHNINRSTEVRCNRAFSTLWQQWHYDYGIFTVLTEPLFMSACVAADCSCLSGARECSSPDGHTYLQLYDTNKNKILVVKSRPESFIIQVGEAADILSRGKLRSTLHSVGMPVELENLSRETFVVFLQPAWDKILFYSGDQSDTETITQDKFVSSRGTSHCNAEDPNPSSVVDGCQESHMLFREIMRKIPPLSSRLRNGMTFAEFSRETTKQYYGGKGTQSRR